MNKKLPLLLVISGFCFSIFCSTSLMRPASANQNTQTYLEIEELQKEKLKKEELEKEKAKKDLKKGEHMEKKNALSTYLENNCQGNNSTSCDYPS